MCHSLFVIRTDCASDLCGNDVAAVFGAVAVVAVVVVVVDVVVAAVAAVVDCC